ncbi:DNA recombination protein RmuC [Candidatus Saccharibacteria bacterium]|nr:DNA recombination protein RmuC [Candidatus Saccharibacteria bacterium]MBR6964876.1 DNA recombination protein RmuC [Candidatus Saccharibacteria bacterium]
MDIFLAILGVIIVALLLVLIFKKPKIALGKEFDQMNERMIRVEGEINKLNPAIDRNFRENRKEIADNLERLQSGNEKKLEEMRETVDEKLKASVEKRFNESFKSISTQLTQVYQGLGEMKNMANEVGDLKKVMEGVKTRGIYGEVQLGAIIEDMLNKSQYEENIITKPGSNDRVEFAIKMPGKEDNVFLPIDSKFPVENYSRLIAAYDAGSKADILTYQKALANDVKEQAKKISTKYLEPPMTTDFGIMFVPTESLYAEIIRIPGLSDEIRKKHSVAIASPSTLPVMLNGLVMGFRTLAIEKRSADVWNTLGAVKTQFGKFGDLLEGVQKKLQESANKIESARTTSRQIERKLKDVEELPEAESVKLIGEV